MGEETETHPLKALQPGKAEKGKHWPLSGFTYMTGKFTPCKSKVRKAREKAAELGRPAVDAGQPSGKVTRHSPGARCSQKAPEAQTKRRGQVHQHESQKRHLSCLCSLEDFQETEF